MKLRYIIALVILFMIIGIDYQRYFYGKIYPQGSRKGEIA